MSNEATPAASIPTPAQPAKPAPVAAPVPTEASKPVLSVKVALPADGKVTAGEPLTIEITGAVPVNHDRFADVLVDWGDGNKGDHVRLFRRDDQMVGRTSHTFAKAGTYSVSVAIAMSSDPADSARLTITCTEGAAK